MEFKKPPEKTDMEPQKNNPLDKELRLPNLQFRMYGFLGINPSSRSWRYDQPPMIQTTQLFHCNKEWLLNLLPLTYHPPNNKGLTVGLKGNQWVFISLS